MASCRKFADCEKGMDVAMRRFLTIAIPIVTLALFICVMLSGRILKRPLGKYDDVPQAIENLIREVNNDDWDKVNSEIDNLENTWKKVIHRVQFASERDEINDLSMNIARLRGAVLAEDKGNSLIELFEAYYHWKEIGK